MHPSCTCDCNSKRVKDKSERDIYHDKFCNMHFTKHITVRCIELYYSSIIKKLTEFYNYNYNISVFRALFLLSNQFVIFKIFFLFISLFSISMYFMQYAKIIDLMSSF